VVARLTFDPYLITRVHVVPVYVLVAATAAALALSLARRWPGPLRRILAVLAGVVAVQALIGYYQFFNGVPELAVGLHMAGAATLAAVATMAVEKMSVVSARAAGEPLAPGQVPEALTRS
jgi:cytochrome c oxidase assembly protein subunit 15